jgi:hypothetical protein
MEEVIRYGLNVIGGEGEVRRYGLLGESERLNVMGYWLLGERKRVFRCFGVSVMRKASRAALDLSLFSLLLPNYRPRSGTERPSRNCISLTDLLKHRPRSGLKHWAAGAEKSVGFMI